MTTDDETTLLQAVIDNPDDDAPRLAYADWCDRRGDPRGRFIRVQVELAKVEFDLESPKRKPLEQESLALLEEHGRKWLPKRDPRLIDCEMHRGFVAGVTISAAAFLSHFSELSVQYPIQHVSLQKLPPHAREVLTSRNLRRVSSLRASRGGINDDDITAFSLSPFVANMWWLGLSNNVIGMKGVEALITSPHLKKLGFVWLRGNPCDPIETAGFDQGCLVDVQLPQAGRELEARFGPIRWFRYRENTNRFAPVGKR